MYNISQFRPSLYLVIAIGFAGFGLALENIPLLLISLCALGINWQLVRSGRFRPMPQWVANVITLSGAAWCFIPFPSGQQAILHIGQFLLIMQIVKLFEQRSNRDYAQLLVLSLLLMVAAIINTAKLSVGLLMLIYLVLSTYTCLLFHLKVETENARKQMGIDDRHLNPLTLRQDQRYLMRSMGRMTGLVGVSSVVIAVIVFLFFPRGAGANLFAMPMIRPQNTQTGLSNEADLQSVTRVKQNNTEVAWLRVTRGTEPVTQGPLYLRAFVFGNYQLDTRSWTEDDDVAGNDLMVTRDNYVLDNTQIEATSEYKQEFIPLRPTGVKVLLAMPGATRVEIDLNPRNTILHSLNNRVIRLQQSLMRDMEYKVYSTGKMPASELQLSMTDRWMSASIPPEITALARNPEISGLDEAGNSLAEQVTPGRPSAINTQIARNFEVWLQQNFIYSLEMNMDSDRDPIVAFLTDHRTGFCEYFASAMTLMCQSLGIPSRYVSGYKVDEFNEMGGYFIVRQSHAHAWVEVLTEDGWTTFDPTTGNSSASATKSTLQWFKHLVDYLQHLWSSNVVAYDAGSQSSIIDKVENLRTDKLDEALTARKSDRSGWLDRLIDGFKASGTIVGVLVMVSVLLLIGAIVYSAVQRVRLSRRANRIGLDIKDASERRRLAEQLGFYDRMMSLLDRAGVRKPDHLTPLEFSQTLTFLPSESYDSIVRMTQIFYRVRFGRTELSDGKRRRLERLAERLDMSRSDLR